MNPKLICKLIADDLFEPMAGQRVLELGPHDGTWFTPHIVRRAGTVALVELDEDCVDTLVSSYTGSADVIRSDFHRYVRDCPPYDSVVLFGVLDHTPSPLGLLEDIVNHISPEHIYIESGYGTGVKLVNEEDNAPGQRQTQGASSNMALQLGHGIYVAAMKNMGYRVETSSTAEEKGSTTFKQGSLFIRFARGLER